MLSRRLAMLGFGLMLSASSCRGLFGIEALDYSPPRGSGGSGGLGGSGGVGGQGGNNGGAAGAGGASCDLTKINDDAANCGACGHDCLGGDCKDAHCLPLVVAGSEFKATFLATSGDWLFWTTAVYGGGKVRACVKNDCKPFTLADGPTSPTDPIYPLGIAVGPGPKGSSALSVYYTIYADFPSTRAGIHVLSFDAQQGKALGDVLAGKQLDWYGATSVIADQGRALVALSYDSAYVASVTPDGATVAAVYDTGRPEPIYDGPPNLAVDDQFIYISLTAIGEVYRVSKNGGVVGKIASGLHQPVALAVDDEFLYWGVRTAQGPQIQKKRKDGLGLVTSLFKTPQGKPDDASIGIITDGKYVYYTRTGTDKPDGSLNRGKVDGTSDAPEVLVSGLAGPSGLLFDGDAIYWATQFDSTIRRLRKPLDTP